MGVPDEVHLAQVASGINEGTVVPFLGAGANLCGRPDEATWSKEEYLPSGQELAGMLIELGKYPDKDDRDLMRISQYIHATLGSQDLYRWVRGPLQGMSKPTTLHALLASVARSLAKRNKPRQVILTTNYDDALERAFEKLGQPYDLLWYEAKPEASHRGRFIHQKRADDLAPDDQGDIRVASSVPIERPNEYDAVDPDTCTVIVKLHGAMVRADPTRDSYVITEDDYIHYLTGADIAGQLPPILSQRIKESHLLFLGYSMRDWNLRVVLERLGGDAVLTNVNWSVQREPKTQTNRDIEQTLWKDRKVDLRFMLLDEYVAKLTVELKTARIAEEARVAEAAREAAAALQRATSEPADEMLEADI